MADINLKTLTPDTSLPTTGFLFGADSQASTNPSVYSTQTVATTLLGSTSLTGDTLTADAPVLNLAQTWNNAAVTFTAIKLNVTSTASAAASLLMDLQTGAVSQFSVGKTGTVTFANGALFSTAAGLDLATNSIARSGSVSFGPSSDLILSRRGTGNLRFGATDAASPVAQTLSVQSVVAGTSNTAGAAFTITGSQGTGTGAGGSIIFKVAPAGGSGTAQNALVDALTISGSTGRLTLGYNSEIGVDKLYSSGGTFIARTDNGYFQTAQQLAIGGGDVFLYRDNSNILALKNVANAQEFRVYETTTGTIYKAILGNRQLIKISGAAFDNGAGASAGTMTNAPTAGNPTKWIPIDDNGTTRYIPAW